MTLISIEAFLRWCMVTSYTIRSNPGEYFVNVEK